MESVVATLLTGTVVFAATNIDDIFILTMFFSQVDGRFRKRHVVSGQFLGFAALTAVSMIGYIGGLVLRREWIGLLGILPIGIGIRRLIQRNDDAAAEMEEAVRNAASAGAASGSGLVSLQTLGVAMITFANGGDNIGVYAPLFAAGGLGRILSLLSLFLLLLALWCYAGDRLSRQPAVADVFSRYGNMLVPIVLIGLGSIILAEHGTYKLIGFFFG